MKKIFLISLLLLLVPQVAFAQNSDIVIFHGITCPHCSSTLENIEDLGLNDILEIDYLEVYENRANAVLFNEAIDSCGIPINQAGVPMLYYNNKCYFGDIQVMDVLYELTDQTGIENGFSDNSVITDSIKTEEPRSNGLLPLIASVGAILLLVAGGYLSFQKK